MPPDRMSQAKSALRVELRSRRRRLAVSQSQAAERAALNLPIPDLPQFSVVGGYHPLGGEMDPGPVLERLKAAGARIVLPAAIGLSEPLEFRLADSPGSFSPDALGVLAPSADSPALRPDLVIAPLLAFDRGGARLGQGGGAYDRTLGQLRNRGPLFVIGLAFAGQELAEVPVEDHDQPLDAILTEMAFVAVRKDR